MPNRLKDCPTYLAGLRRALEAQAVGDVRQTSFLVTGATGLIGSALVDLLLGMNDILGWRQRIYAAGRHPDRIRERFGRRNDLVAVPYDASLRNGFDFTVDCIVHAASNASPDLYMLHPVETMVANFDGLLELLDFGRRSGASRLLYVSSSEVYGRKDTDRPFAEDDYGNVDILNVRSSYAEAKRAAETLAVSYAAEHGIDVVIARPGHVYGPTARESDKRVSSSFAWAAARGEDLVMKSDGRTVRSYCHCLDCATALEAVLRKGASGTAYNVSNPASVISIRRMAELMAGAAGVSLRVECPTESERRAFNPMDNASLNAVRLLGLGWKPVFSAEAGIRETINAMREVLR